MGKRISKLIMKPYGVFIKLIFLIFFFFSCKQRAAGTRKLKPGGFYSEMLNFYLENVSSFARNCKFCMRSSSYNLKKKKKYLKTITTMAPVPLTAAACNSSRGDRGGWLTVRVSRHEQVCVIVVVFFKSEHAQCATGVEQNRCGRVKPVKMFLAVCLCDGNASRLVSFARTKNAANHKHELCRTERHRQ